MDKIEMLKSEKHSVILKPNYLVIECEACVKLHSHPNEKAVVKIDPFYIKLSEVRNINQLRNIIKSSASADIKYNGIISLENIQAAVMGVCKLGSICLEVIFIEKIILN